MTGSRYGTKWTAIGLAASGAIAASYMIHARSTSFTHGGSGMGLLYGALALALIGVLLFYGVRKRRYRSTFGTMEEWLQSHIWLGIVAFVAIVAHTGFRFQDRVAVALFVVVTAVVVSGIVGAILYKTVPRILTDVETDLTAEQISDQLNQISRSMARIASGKSATFQRIHASLLREVAPRPLAAWTLVLAGPARRASQDVQGDWARMLGLVNASEQEELRQLLVTSRQQRELHKRLLGQQRYRNLLDVWLWIHLPLSIAMIVLILAHLAGVLLFARIAL
jgi:hypothetical protein